MNKIYLSLLILCLLGSACVKTDKTSSEENSTDFNKLDSIVVKALVIPENGILKTLNKCYDQETFYYSDSSYVFINEGAYIEIQEDLFSTAYYKRISARYWLRNSNKYNVANFVPQPLIKSENADLQTDAEAMFFKELIETVYADLEYKKNEEYNGVCLISFATPDKTDSDYEEWLIHEKQQAAVKRFFEEEIFHLKCKETYDKQLKFLEERKETVSSEFYELCKSFFFCDYISSLTDCYQSYKTEDLKEQLKEQLLAAKADFQNDKLIFSPHYRAKTIIYNAVLANVERSNREDVEGLRKQYNASKENFTGKTREFLMFYFTKELIKTENIALAKQYLEEASDEDYKAYIAAKLQLLEMNQAIDNGELPSDILMGMNDSQITLTDMFNEYKGKYIYLDFWASWCGPCRALMPKSHELKAKYKDDVHFVYISTDKDAPAWKMAVKQENLSPEDSYLISDKSEFIKNKQVKTIPRYMIIDREGKIINDNAFRPDDPEFDEKMMRIIKNVKD
ncbi:thiol-disulfide isomerase/thioredoxin [Dysgonomonadaceae bacterium PH5-43]|nr:thiol-disulfide isomerase/thioredoxin [Dysgonomonadaceae bacterium PH5-43]